jgi:hypothetical protein
MITFSHLDLDDDGRGGGGGGGLGDGAPVVAAAVVAVAAAAATAECFAINAARPAGGGARFVGFGVVDDGAADVSSVDDDDDGDE